MRYIFDSSALIYLGKIKLLSKVMLLEGNKFIPQSVYDEVISIGIQRMEPEVGYIKEIIDKKAILIKNPKVKIDGFQSLSLADKDVLALAKETSSIAIIDEIYARNVADSYGIEHHGTIYLILKLLQKRIIKKEEAVNSIDNMIKLGFYLSTVKYKEILDVIKKM